MNIKRLAGDSAFWIFAVSVIAVWAIHMWRAERRERRKCKRS